MSGSALPLVSIVIPVRDRLDLLQRAVRSASVQTESRIEIVIVDDGSAVPVDATVLSASVPIRVIRNGQSLGAQRSRLIGSRAAAGRYVALLDSDDWWHPEKLERQLAIVVQDETRLVSCRVVAARGPLRREAPWRPLAPGEKVEEFLYVHRGMLQSSTILAERSIVADLLQSSADGRVHNDTMLFLEAQRRGFGIVQMSEALSYFDDNPRRDRVSYDIGRMEASEAWFLAVSSGWSVEARRGFVLTDMVTRYVNTGQRWRGLATLLRAYHPKLRKRLYLKKFFLIICNGSPLRFFSNER